MAFQHFPKQQFTTMAWKNGGGITHEITRQPEMASDWQWRISIAEIHQDGPFSAFPGCDRALTLLSGAGMTLHFADRVEVMNSVYDTLRFQGEEAVTAVLSEGRPPISMPFGSAMRSLSRSNVGL